MIIKKTDKNIKLINLSQIIKKSVNNKRLESDPCNFVKMEDITNKINHSVIKEYKDVKSGFTKFNYSDILIAKITPCFENGKGALVDLKDGGFGSTEFMVLSPINEFVKDFIYHVTQSNKLRVLGEPLMVGGGGQRRVPKEFILNYEIPHLEDLEYFKIGCFLNVQMNRIEKIKMLLAKIEIRNQYYAEKLVSGEIKLNNSLSMINEKFENIIKEHKKSKVMAGDSLKVGLYPFFNCSKKQTLHSNDYLIDDSVLLLSTGGNPSVNYYNGKFSYSTDVWCLNSKYAKYLYYFYNSNIDKIEQCFQGGGLKHLSKKDFKNIEITIPNNEKDIQDIVDYLDNLNDEKEKVEKLLKLEEQRFDWLSDKLLSGEYIIED